MAELSPMMRQYLALKEQYPDTILFFRLGDFYEMFFEDATTAAKELELTLTGRDCGLEERAPMCGVPYHSVNQYIAKMVEKGYKVAICEQLSDPATSKGLVERDVVRIITPGTKYDASMLDEKVNSFIAALIEQNKKYALAWADVSTGEFYVCEYPEKGLNEQLFDILAGLHPNELLGNDNIKRLENVIRRHCGGELCKITLIERYTKDIAKAADNLRKHFNVQTLDVFDCGHLTTGLLAADMLLTYLHETQKNALSHISKLSCFYQNETMILDAATKRNLEICETIRDHSKKGSLLWVLDQCQTAMGARMLRMNLEQPLQNIDQINKRLDGVEELVNRFRTRETLKEYLIKVYDIERLSAKISYGTINPRDCLALAKTLSVLPGIINEVNQCTAPALKEIGAEIDAHQALADTLNRAIADQPPIIITEGGIIKEGYSEELDRYRSLAQNSKAYIIELETREREATGIKNLKIAYNKVFGYYIEVTKSNISQVPYRYERKQTLTNCERYVTDELKKLEQELLGVEEKSVKLEYDLFIQIRELLLSHLHTLQSTSTALAKLDVLVSLADTAVKHSYVKPRINTEGYIRIQDGRHPFVEAMQKQAQFVPNDTLLDMDENRFMIITGPNMAGKSTYMRQVALITLMAHVGSFVPAKEADICIVDRIFTRVGASDDLSSGQSTFMLEMNEVSNILHNATKNSLIILDEIGRGTSTFDGLSIAWAVTEYVADKEKCGAKTLFATHYHELSELEGHLQGVKNYFIAVKEMGEDIIFLRKILRGSADKSFGIQVARLAGLPSVVVKRSRQILKRLEEADISKGQISANILKEKAPEKMPMQLSMLPTSGAQEIIDKLKEIDINTLTPVNALNILCELRELAKREDY